MVFTNKTYKESILLILIFIVFISLRLPTLSFYLHGDEGEQVLRFIINKDHTGWAQPPLNMFWLSLFIPKSLNEFDNFYARIPYFILSMGVFFLIYQICKFWFSKNSALWTVLILSISTWHILSSYLNHADGVILQFLFLISTYFYLMFKKTNKNFYLLLIGISLGFGLLIKFAAILMFIIILIYEFYDLIFYKRQNLFLIFKNNIKIFFISITFFFLGFFIIDGLYFGQDPLLYLKYIVNHNSDYIPTFLVQDVIHLIFLSIQTVFLSFSLLIFFILMIFYSTKDHNITSHKNKIDLNVFFLIWIIVVLFFYLIIITSPVRPLEQYLSIIIPPLSGIFGMILSGLNLKKRDLIHMSLLISILFLSFYFISLKTGEFISLHPRAELAARFLTFQWDYYIPFHSSSGPVGFFIKAPIIAISILLTLILSFIFILCSLNKKLKIYKKIILLIISTILISQNLIMSLEHSYSITTPNLNIAYSNLVDELNHKIYYEPIYFYYQPSELYVSKYNNRTYFDVGKEEDHKFIEELKRNAKTIVVFDFQIMNKNSSLWKFITSCEQKYSYKDQYRNETYIFTCNNH